ncbi:MAG: cytochrome c biogenesis protein/redoxin [Aggregatilineales bacterium]
MFEVVITFIAGIVSFISPCVLPLVPAYIGYMGGRVTNTVAAQVAVNADGTAVATGRPASVRFSTFLHGVAFVAGFTFIFVLLGVLSTAVLQQFGGRNIVLDIIGRIGGIIIIFFGLHFMGIMPSLFLRIKGMDRENINTAPFLIASITFAVAGALLFMWGLTGTVTPWNPPLFREPPTWAIIAGGVGGLATIALMAMGGAFTQPVTFWNKAINTIERALYADTRREMVAKGDQGFGGSAIMGIVFAAGWTPCIGPMLGSAMTLAVSSGADAARGGVLLAAYSLGLGIPFLLTALMLDSAQGILRKLQRQMRLIELISGAFLVLIGILIATGQLQSLSLRFSNQFADVSTRIESCVVGFFEGDVPFNQVGGCLNGDEVEVSAETATNVNSIENSSVGSSFTPNTTIEGLAANSEPVTGLRIGNRAPNFETTLLDGTPVSLEDFLGQTVLLNFWYTACPPCEIEMPDIQEAYETYLEQGFVVLAINREEQPENILPFANNLNLTFPILLDEEGDIQAQYDIRGYPTTFVIDRDGIIRHWNPGFLTATQIQEFIEDSLS